MFKTRSDFKIGNLYNLECQKFEIRNENKQLDFYVEGKNNGNIFSLNFVSIISLEEMLNFKLNEHIDFMKYVDDNDIVFEKNGVFDLNIDIKMDIIRFLPKSFLIMVYFRDRDNLVGQIELSFSVYDN